MGTQLCDTTVFQMCFSWKIMGEKTMTQMIGSIILKYIFSSVLHVASWSPNRFESGFYYYSHFYKCGN